jgi:hypothetical protein
LFSTYTGLTRTSGNTETSASYTPSYTGGAE